MQVEVFKILNNDNNKVMCKTDYGIITLKWNGSAPYIGSAYEIEIDVPSILQWDVDIRLTNERIAFYSTEKETIIVGDIVEIGDDGYTVVQVGRSLISVIVNNLSSPANSRVKIITNDVMAYPVSY